MILAFGEAQSSDPTPRLSRVGNRVRYADPICWLLATAVERAFLGCAIDVQPFVQDVGMIVVNNTGPVVDNVRCAGRNAIRLFVATSLMFLSLGKPLFNCWVHSPRVWFSRSYYEFGFTVPAGGTDGHYPAEAVDDFT